METGIDKISKEEDFKQKKMTKLARAKCKLNKI